MTSAMTFNDNMGRWTDEQRTPWGKLKAPYTAMNPTVPTLAEVIDKILSPSEAEQFAAYLHPRIECGEGTKRVAHAYLWATKGADT